MNLFASFDSSFRYVFNKFFDGQAAGNRYVSGRKHPTHHRLLLEVCTLCSEQVSTVNQGPSLYLQGAFLIKVPFRYESLPLFLCVILIYTNHKYVLLKAEWTLCSSLSFIFKTFDVFHSQTFYLVINACQFFNFKQIF